MYNGNYCFHSYCYDNKPMVTIVFLKKLNNKFWKLQRSPFFLVYSNNNCSNYSYDFHKCYEEKIFANTVYGLHRNTRKCFHKFCQSFAPGPGLSTWDVREAAAGSSTSQKSSPCPGATRAAGSAGPSPPSNTCYRITES